MPVSGASIAVCAKLLNKLSLLGYWRLSEHDTIGYLVYTPLYT